MIDSGFIQRRTFLQKSLMIVTTALAGTACSFIFSPNLKEVAKEATSLLRHPEMAANIGYHYLQQKYQADKPTVEEMITGILEGTAIDPSNASHFSLFNLDDELRAKVRKDFMLERIAKIKGWLLSETEAQLCALLVLIGKT